MLKRLEDVMREQCVIVGASLEEFGGEKDHVHLLVSYPAKVAISALVKSLKGVSARVLGQEFGPEIKQALWGDHFWSPSYCAVSAGGAPLEVIRKYIEDQDRPPSAKQEEMAKVVEARWKRSGRK